MAKAFADKLKPAPVENALVVDALNLGFRWKHKGVFDFAEDYVRTVKSLAKSYNCGSIIITADWGSSTYRKALSPEYKQNREDLRADQTEKDKQNFEKFIQEYLRTLDHLGQEGYPVLKFQGVEADDIAAFIVKHMRHLCFEKLWLVSSDRDWDLLVDENVSRFSYVTRKETTLETWPDFYDFPIEDYISFKCLTGDKGDNVAGIDSIGPKRATQLIKEYGSVFDIYDACPINGKYKYIQNLNSQAERLLLNVELMDLLTYCDEAIGSENISKIYDRIEEYNNVQRM